MSSQIEFIKQITNPFKFFFFKWMRLPSLAFWGVKIGNLNKEQCNIAVNQSWTNKNPFGSVYFSALLGSAELSTGLLVLMNIYGQEFSMLVVGSTASFTKKARGKLTFVCEQGNFVKNEIDRLGKGQSTKFDLHSKGYDQMGDEIGTFVFTWSIKKK